MGTTKLHSHATVITETQAIAHHTRHRQHSPLPDHVISGGKKKIEGSLPIPAKYQERAGDDDSPSKIGGSKGLFRKRINNALFLGSAPFSFPSGRGRDVRQPDALTSREKRC
ncbi:hypothetical protein JTE90_019872 [Oedothorax gibbosus]|uniref:Uncharacterized protein n=1 Tax=Oedothorax gibbosus TaxID=931172 RepID=A0AAV6VYW0_9ARAC|nr:hypothetical protein JTE90_019872 [Oedothorax gibbosus]